MLIKQSIDKDQTSKNVKFRQKNTHVCCECWKDFENLKEKLKKIKIVFQKEIQQYEYVMNTKIWKLNQRYEQMAQEQNQAVRQLTTRVMQLMIINKDLRKELELLLQKKTLETKLSKYFNILPSIKIKKQLNKEQHLINSVNVIKFLPSSSCSLQTTNTFHKGYKKMDKLYSISPLFTPTPRSTSPNQKFKSNEKKSIYTNLVQ